MAFSPGSEFDRPLSEINITPFVDVMLVLLVMFMVTAPLLESGIPIALPKTVAKSLPKEEHPLTLSLNAEGHLFLNQQEIPRQELGAALQRMLKNRVRKDLLLRADGELPYRTVAEIMALVQKSGVQKMGLVTQPEERARGK